MSITWFDLAECAQVGGEHFFPNKGASTAQARTVCANCDVREQCLQYAINNNEHFGIWGGKTERERRQISRGAA